MAPDNVTQAESPEPFLSQLRRVNTDRYHAWVGDGQDAGILFDAAELGGEVGELLNVVKKLEREERGWRGSRAAPEDFADECADVLICLDKLARRRGVDLAAATIAKFNATSEKVGLPHRLAFANEATPSASVERIARDEAVRALEIIRGHTDADDDTGYRADDREGCLDAVFAEASRALEYIAALPLPVPSAPQANSWTPMSQPPLVGGHYAVGGYVSRGSLPRHFERAYATCILTEDGPSWSHCDPAKAHVPLQYWFDLAAHPKHEDRPSAPQGGE